MGWKRMQVKSECLQFYEGRVLDLFNGKMVIDVGVIIYLFVNIFISKEKFGWESNDGIVLYVV